MRRLFVALRPPIEVRRRLIAAMGGVAEARWQDDDQLHVTLRYIGPVDQRVADDIATALGDVHAAPLILRVSGVGTFDRSGRPEAIWAGVTPRGTVAALHRKIDHAMIRIGLAPERRAYLPHATLARLSRRGGPTDRFLADQATLTSDPFTVDHFLLYESHFGHGGARYEAVARYRLST